MIRLTIPSIDRDDIKAMADAVESGYLTQGQRVASFEQAVADYVGTKHAIAISNCTSALHLGLISLNVRPGDIVLVTAYSWIATANVIELCGAQPVFVDIQPESFCMNPALLAETLKKLTSNDETAKKVKAILPVHVFGQMAEMDKIISIADQYGLPVIEDAACALGAKWLNRSAGTWGVMGCFSFHPRKVITTGEGGMITTNDDRLAKTLRSLRNHGQDPDNKNLDFIMPGFNNRMTEFQAALGLAQMKKLDRIINVRRQLANQYDQLLVNKSLKPPKCSPKSWSVYQSYVVLLFDSSVLQLEELILRLREEGIETKIGNLNIPLTTYYRLRYGYSPGDFPVTDQVASSSLALPIFESLSYRDQEVVIQKINYCIEQIYG